MLTNYSLINLPFHKSGSELTATEAQEYFDWFVSVIPERIGVLNGLVQENEPLISKGLDVTNPDSLIPLGNWLKENVSAVKRTENELQTLKKNVVGPLRHISDQVIQDWELSPESLSLAYDVGMYFGEVLIAEQPEKLKWRLRNNAEIDSIDNDYNQPVVQNVLWVNPVHLVRVLEYGFVDGTRDSSRLHELYKIWKNDLDFVS